MSPIERLYFDTAVKRANEKRRERGLKDLTLSDFLRAAGKDRAHGAVGQSFEEFATKHGQTRAAVVLDERVSGKHRRRTM